MTIQASSAPALDGFCYHIVSVLASPYSVVAKGILTGGDEAYMECNIVTV